jgi:uncharacterized protein DUF5985
MRTFLWGALTMGCAVIALYFLRYWRRSHDRLFVFFGVAFAVLALNWVSLAIIDPMLEGRHYVYFFRLAAFLLIIIGIVDRNRRSRRQ